jgi:hypothetical protein
LKTSKKYDVSSHPGETIIYKFCVCFEKDSNAHFSYLRRSKKYVVSQLYILSISHKGVLRGTNSDSDDWRPGERRIISDNLVKRLSNVMVFPTVSLAG